MSVRMKTPPLPCASPPGRASSPLARLGSPSPSELSSRVVRATLDVVRDLLAVKYGQSIDDADFLSKAAARCDMQERLSASTLLEALNSEPALKLKDAANSCLLQLRFECREVISFAELSDEVAKRPGTACAVAEVPSDRPGLRAHPIAVFRRTYSQADALTGRTTWDMARPLRQFKEGEFQGAVIIDPIVLKVQNLKMLELQVPAMTEEYVSADQTTESPESNLAAKACLVLAGVSSGAQGSKKQEAAKHACDLAKDFMARFPFDPAVQESACQVLGNLAAQAGPSSISLAGQVTATMRKHGNSAAVVEAACKALAGLSGGGSACQASIASSGGIEQIIAAMRLHPDAAGVQTWACGAIAGLVINHPPNQSAVMAAKGLDVVGAAMRKHISVSRLQAMACGALGNLVSNHRDNQAAVACSGAIGLAIAAMREHPEIAEVQQSACGTLWCFAIKHPGNQSAIAANGGIELIAAAMKKHQGNAGVQVMVRGALRALAAEHTENQNAIAACGGSKLLHAVMAARTVADSAKTARLSGA
eukprot:gnl/MRDRNA2_/MRDRNA2_29154_c0_seq1.p1 gnl/MRDRNA2_/MRDRNA2_29154_c0~~gnl/MRDRNA2_/MRDRNA2_29154_c0_seq1.p1  ORF type:complete len:536 (-),score=135.90 gnl/MRDRNA2_/MRDRNA2_29154_c0_seq1:161-1768(-)